MRIQLTKEELLNVVKASRENLDSVIEEKCMREIARHVRLVLPIYGKVKA